MKKFGKKIAAAVLALVLALGMLTGCNGGTSEQSQTKLFTYDGTDVYLDEAWVYAEMSKTMYETYYGAYYGEDFWTMEVSQDEDGNMQTFEDVSKQGVITQIKQVKILVNDAEELGVSLTAEEKAAAKETAETFCKKADGKAILKTTGASKNTIIKIYEENALASKVQKEMVKDVDTNVTEDEARRTSVYKLVFKTTTTDSESGETVEMSKEEKAEQLKKAEEALANVKGGTDIAELAETLGLTSDAEETYAAGESLAGEDFEKAMKELKDGEIADKVFETEDAYVVAKLVAYTDEEATAQAKEDIIMNREYQLYQEKYEELVKDLDAAWVMEEEVDQEAWAKVTFAAEAEEETSEEAGSTSEEAGSTAEEAGSTTEE